MCLCLVTCEFLVYVICMYLNVNVNVCVYVCIQVYIYGYPSCMIGCFLDVHQVLFL